MIVSKDVVEGDREKSKTWPQILTVLIACLTSITCAAQLSWSSPFIVKITKDKINYNITQDEASHFATIHPFAAIVFSFFTPVINDSVGRKTILMLMAVPHIIFWIFTAIARNIWVFYISRIFSGLGDALHFSVLPMYLGEIATPRVRGTWANMANYLSIGNFLINLIGQNFTVWQTSYICVILPILFIILMYFMPESPYYHVMQNQEGKAKQSLRFLRGKQDVEEEFFQIKADTERQMSETGTWKDLLFVESNRKSLLIGAFLRVSQKFSAFLVFHSYINFIFDKSGSDISPSASVLIITGLTCVVNLFASYIAELLGRKKAYMISSLSAGIVLCLEAIYFYIDQKTGTSLEFINWFPLVGMIAFVIATSFGIGPVPIIMLGELFSNSVKTKGTGVLTIVSALAIFVTNGIFYALVSRYGMFSPFLFFGVCTLATGVMSAFFIPETKGKTLEEIQQSLKGNKR